MKTRALHAGRCLSVAVALMGVALTVLVVGKPAAANESSDAGVVPVAGHKDLVRRSVHFWSDGTRVAGDLTYPRSFSEDKKYPCIVMCHGWGGIKGHLNREIGPRFAKAGYIVFTFDYRGWGESNSRLIVDADEAKPDADGNITVTAKRVS